MPAMCSITFGRCRCLVPDAIRRSIFSLPGVIARNAYPSRKPEVQILCPTCGDIFPGLHGQEAATCRTCKTHFNPERGTAKGAKATCPHCTQNFTILDAVASTGTRPGFRLYGKLVLTRSGDKAYLPATVEDHAAYQECTARLQEEIRHGSILLPTLALETATTPGRP